MNRNILKSAALFFGVVFSASAISATAGAEDKPKRDPGQKLYMTKTCMACHGKDGRNAMLDYPNLAGQDEKYLVSQINDIINGKRLGSPDATGNPRSQGMRGALIRAVDNKPTISPDEVKQIAKWLSAQEPADLQAPNPALDPASVAAGEQLYKAQCMSCHGPEGKKPQKGKPYVAGQKRNYILTQLQDIRSKDRKNSKTGPMFGIVKKMTDEEFANLADYLSQVDRKAGQ